MKEISLTQKIVVAENSFLVQWNCQTQKKVLLLSLNLKFFLGRNLRNLANRREKNIKLGTASNESNSGCDKMFWSFDWEIDGETNDSLIF